MLHFIQVTRPKGKEDEIDAIIARGDLRPKHVWKLILLPAFFNFSYEMSSRQR
jgi:hypothetical protein